MTDGAYGLLELYIIEAQLHKTKNALVQVIVDGTKRHATQVHHTKYPVWNVRLHLLLENAHSIKLNVMDKRWMNKKTVKSVELPHPLIETTRPTELLLPLREDCHLRVRYTFTKKPDEIITNGEQAMRALVFGLPCVVDDRDATIKLSVDHSLLEFIYSQKGHHHKRMLVDDVWEARPGNYIRDRKEGDEHIAAAEREKWVKIVHGAGFQEMNITLRSKVDAETLAMAFTEVMAKKNLVLRGTHHREIWMKYLWTKFDENFDGHLCADELEELFHYVNFSITREILKQCCKSINNTASSSSNGPVQTKGLIYEDFTDMLHKLVPRKDVQEIFAKYATDNVMTLTSFHTFLRDEQKEDHSLEAVKDMMRLYCKTVKDGAANEDPVFNFDEFLAYIDSLENNGYNSSYLLEYQDMTRPLSHYWINSSHNTYLLEDQLKGPSSIEAYIRALRAGCRCVELDCWDGELEPVIYHGYTLTSKILFRDVLVACREHAFVSSPYPVIFSIENHCSHEQQVMMAKFMTEILGDALYTTPPDESADRLPSPMDLKMKFLIKGKKIKVDKKTGEATQSNDDESDEEPEAITKTNVAPPALATELSDLVTLLQGVHFYDFETSKQKGKYYQMSSMTEYKVETLAEDFPTEFIEYNERQLSRIYPVGSRVNSSNYDPTPAYNSGCQIVALNYQTNDRGMQILRGRFQTNGGTGYVLKPSFMIDKHFESPPTAMSTVTIKIISASRLPKPCFNAKGERIDPYVKLEICGLGKDTKVRTKHVENSGLHVTWNESFSFNIQARDWETALLRMAVYDDDKLEDDVICGHVSPLKGLRQGYRSFPLRIPEGLVCVYANIFAHITVA